MSYVYMITLHLKKTAPSSPSPCFLSHTYPSLFVTLSRSPEGHMFEKRVFGMDPPWHDVVLPTDTMHVPALENELLLHHSHPGSCKQVEQSLFLEQLGSGERAHQAE